MAKKILVADDSKTIQRVVELTFKNSGFSVAAAGTAQDALHKLAELRPDLVFADITMPGRDGYELCAAIHAQQPSLPVVLLAGAFEAFDEGRASAAGASGHIKKPFDTQSMLSLARQLTGVSDDTSLPPSFAASLARRQEAKTNTPFATASGTVAPAPVSVAPPAPKAPVIPSAPPVVSSAPAATPPRPTVADRPAPRPMADDLVSARPAPLPAFGAPRSEARAEPALPPRIEVPPEPKFEAPKPEVPKFEAPRFEAPKPEVPKFEAPRATQIVAPEPELDVLEEVELLDEDHAIPTGPTLEPPTFRSAAERANVDVWALADEQPAVLQTGPTKDLRPATNDIPTRDMSVQAPMPQMVTILTDAVAAPIARAAQGAVPGLSEEKLIQVAREVIERVAWEVVPDLAETIIRAELKRLLAEE